MNVCAFLMAFGPWRSEIRSQHAILSSETLSSRDEIEQCTLKTRRGRQFEDSSCLYLNYDDLFGTWVFSTW